jgi:hypothetical protein
MKLKMGVPPGMSCNNGLVKGEAYYSVTRVLCIQMTVKIRDSIECNGSLKNE